MEQILIPGLFIFLCGYIIFQQIHNNKIVKDLTLKIMAKDVREYATAKESKAVSKEVMEEAIKSGITDLINRGDVI